MSRQSRTDLAAAVAVMLVGAFFLILAGQIHTPRYQTAAEAMVGPAMVPTIIAVLILALGALYAVMVLLRHKSGAAEQPDGADVEFVPFTLPVLFRLAAVVAIGFAYVWLLPVVGYVISTGIILAIMLVLFGSRPTISLLAVVIVGTAIYYYLFIKLMGIYLPGGWLIDIG